MSGLFDRLMTRLIRRGTLKVTYASGDSSTYGEPAQGYPDVAVRFTDGKVGRDIVLDPRLGAGEAYMDGRIVMERGGVMELIELVQANNRWEKRGTILAPSLTRRLAVKAAFLARQFNKPGSSKRNVAHHYDIGNALYKLMLDAEHMQYSCAYWPREGMTLEQAQEAKLAQSRPSWRWTRADGGSTSAAAGAAWRSTSPASATSPSTASLSAKSRSRSPRNAPRRPAWPTRCVSSWSITATSIAAG